MDEILFCSKCLYSTKHPFGLTLNNNGICSGCSVHEEKYNIDWDAKLSQLNEYVQRNPKHNNNPAYDCVVPVTGDSNSFYILDFVINKLNLNPLAVIYNKHWNTEVGIKNIALMKTTFDCDFYQKNINPNVVKKITQYSLSKFKSAYWHIHAGHYVLPVQLAVEFNIHLIIWGAHEGVEQVGMFSHEDKAEMSYRHWIDHHLSGALPENFHTVFDSFNERDLLPFKYPSAEDILSSGVKGIYLSNYSLWDPSEQNYFIRNKYKTYTHKHSRTFDIYEHVDCFNYMNLHDYLKFLKLGYSKVTDHLCREIRHGRISRDSAISMVREFERAPVLHMDLFEKWTDIKGSSWDFLFSEVANPSFTTPIYPTKIHSSPLSNYLHPGNDFWTSKRFKEIFLQVDDNTIEMGSDYQLVAKGM
tara:strand:- start:9359 stop:10603 length:1245 start_codon:yes stop_codon:yes gene_type:complete